MFEKVAAKATLIRAQDVFRLDSQTAQIGDAGIRYGIRGQGSDKGGVNAEVGQ